MSHQQHPQVVVAPSNYTGLGFTGALTILFVALKLTHVIHWSWWWVTSPVWISATIGVTLLVLAGVLALVSALVTK